MGSAGDFGPVWDRYHEIDGFDNLHHAEGILKDAMEAAAIYRADRSWYLVNGSTCGILSAVLRLRKTAEDPDSEKLS